MEQPSWDDDVLAWRRYAEELRQRLGAVKRSAEAATAAELDEALAGLARAHDHKLLVEAKSSARNAELRSLRGEHRRLLAAHRHLGRRMDTLARILLDDGDVATATDVLAKRRARIAAARDANT